jgi:hypothetical protein
VGCRMQTWSASTDFEIDEDPPRDTDIPKAAFYISSNLVTGRHLSKIYGIRYPLLSNMSSARHMTTTPHGFLSPFPSSKRTCVSTSDADTAFACCATAPVSCISPRHLTFLFGAAALVFGAQQRLGCVSLLGRLLLTVLDQRVSRAAAVVEPHRRSAGSLHPIAPSSGPTYSARFSSFPLATARLLPRGTVDNCTSFFRLLSGYEQCWHAL